jgi:large subunit ribosomal protein L7/L12
MSEETATVEFSSNTKELAEQIANLTLIGAKELSDCLEQEHGIKAAAGGGAVMMAAPGGDAGGAAEVQTEFDVVLTGFGDKKLDVVKVVKAITGASLMDAKKMVESCPATLKEAVSKEDADKVKSDVEAAGGAVEVK